MCLLTCWSIPCIGKSRLTLEFSLTLQKSRMLQILLLGTFSRKVDVVILNSASLRLVHQVLRTGQIIFATNPDREMDYAMKKQKEYFDFKYRQGHQRTEKILPGKLTMVDREVIESKLRFLRWIMQGRDST